MSEFLTSEEAAAKLRLTVKTIQKWCRLGKLAHSRVGHKGPHNCGDIRIPAEAIAGLLSARFRPARQDRKPAAKKQIYRILDGA